MKRTIMTLICLAAFAPLSNAATMYWNGSANDGDYTNGANWDGGTAPRSNDWQDTARFDLAVPETITVPSSRDVFRLRFDTAGWTLVGGIDEFKDIYSTGAGTNTIDGDMDEVKGNETWDVVGSDHTLRVTGEVRYYDQNITLTGGGTLWANRLDAAGFSSPTFTLSGATLRLDDSRPHESSGDNGVIQIDIDGILQMTTSNVSSIESLFGSEIVDLTGNGLQAVYDSGSGLTTVSAIPEPSSILLLLGGLAAMGLFVRRK